MSIRECDHSGEHCCIVAYVGEECPMCAMQEDLLEATENAERLGTLTKELSAAIDTVQGKMAEIPRL